MKLVEVNHKNIIILKKVEIFSSTYMITFNNKEQAGLFLEDLYNAIEFNNCKDLVEIEEHGPIIVIYNENIKGIKLNLKEYLEEMGYRVFIKLMHKDK
jgi:hypothetical protein